MTTVVNKASHKVKQLTEAIELLDDISYRIAWATDFCKYDSINEILDEVYRSVDDAQSQLEENLEELEQAIVVHDEQQQEHQKEFEERTDLNYLVS